MKKIIFLLFASVLLKVSYAQLPIKKEKLVKIGNKDYVLTSFDKGKFVSNRESDLYTNKKLPYNPSQLDMSGIDAIKTSKLIYEQIRNNLPVTRLYQLAKDKDILSMEIIFIPNGKIKHIIFNYSNNSLITLNEIDLLDEAIKKNVRVMITKPELYNNIPYIVFMPHHIRFSKLYP